MRKDLLSFYTEFWAMHTSDHEKKERKKAIRLLKARWMQNRHSKEKALLPVPGKNGKKEGKKLI